jgi:hypothetical protein
LLVLETFCQRLRSDSERELLLDVWLPTAIKGPLGGAQSTTYSLLLPNAT